MAKVTLNPIFQDVNGKSGNLVFRRSRNGKTWLIKLADMSNVTWSDEQQNHRKAFKAANEYAKAAMADPQVRASYEEAAREQNRQPYRVAVSDYFKGKNLLANQNK
jgi:hypothetical protein